VGTPAGDAATAFDRSERVIWSGSAAAYAATFAAVCAHPVPTLLDAVGVEAGDRLLDVGTGTGAVAAAAVARGATVTAVDAESSMVEAARARVPQADVLQARLPWLPVEARTFDVAVANFVLNHVGRPRAAVAELCRVLRPGGRVGVSLWPAAPPDGQTLTVRSIQAAGVPRPDDLPRLEAADDFPRTSAGVTELLTEAGLTDVECRALGWTHVVERDAWWQGLVGGVGCYGHLVASQEVATIARIRRCFDELSAPFLAADGRLHLPYAALLATGTR
jgi:SAM-dependent methyltransferase